MKMTKQDYYRLEDLIAAHIERASIGPIEDYDITPTNYRWSIYHTTLDHLQYSSVEDYIFIRSLYDYCNDNHIDTALRNMIQ